MAADFNLLGSVGDLYCFSNTHSMPVNQAIKDKLTMNSSEYTLVTYLSDKEWKFIPCHFCILRLSYFDGLMSRTIRQNSPVVLEIMQSQYITKQVDIVFIVRTYMYQQKMDSIN